MLLNGDQPLPLIHMANSPEKDQAQIILSRIQQDSRLQRKAERLEEKYTYRPKLEADKPLRYLALFGKYLFSLISIALAFYFVQSLFWEATRQEELSLLLAALILAFVEFLKHITLPKIANHYFLIQEQIKAALRSDRGFRATDAYRHLRTQQIKVPFLIFNVALILLSVFLSVKGIQLYNEEKMAIKPTLIHTDSLMLAYESKLEATQKMYDQQIQALQADEKAFKASVSWKGKINIYNPANRKLLSDYSDRLQTLAQEKKEALSRLQTERQSVLKEAKSTNQSRLRDAENQTRSNGLHLIGFASMSELGCILCLYFLCVSDFKALQEIRQAESVMRSRPQRSYRKSPVPSLTKTSNPVGFEVNSHRLPAKTAKQRRVLELYHEKNLKKMDIHKLTGISRSTIDKVLQEYRL